MIKCVKTWSSNSPDEEEVVANIIYQIISQSSALNALILIHIYGNKRQPANNDCLVILIDFAVQ